MSTNSSRYTRYDKKFKVLKIRFSPKDFLLLQKKYEGFGQAMARDFLLNKEHKSTVVNKVHFDKSLINQVSKIGNNINQIALISNAKKDFTHEGELKKHLLELKQILTKIYEDKRDLTQPDEK